MPVQVRTLKVRPNPWIGHDTINRIGLPMGRVAVEQPAGSFDPRFVGARIKEVILASAAPKGAPLAQESHDHVVEYDAEATVTNTPYYRRRVMAGELIALDRASFVAAGGKPKDFEDHQKHLDARKAEAIAEFDLMNGEGAFVALGAQREEDARTRAQVKESADAAKATEPAAVANEPKAAPKKGDDK